MACDLNRFLTNRYLVCVLMYLKLPCFKSELNVLPTGAATCRILRATWNNSENWNSLFHNLIQISSVPVSLLKTLFSAHAIPTSKVQDSKLKSPDPVGTLHRPSIAATAQPQPLGSSPNRTPQELIRMFSQSLRECPIFFLNFHLLKAHNFVPQPNFFPARIYLFNSIMSYLL